eukprot:JP439744.1.p1 GENE.JP439744.1~~JP439744.1.p1  ORF type:complete len:99 (-),score=10.64 JP439744.1:85-381(-)
MGTINTQLMEAKGSSKELLRLVRKLQRKTLKKQRKASMHHIAPASNKTSKTGQKRDRKKHSEKRPPSRSNSAGVVKKNTPSRVSCNFLSFFEGISITD